MMVLVVAMIIMTVCIMGIVMIVMRMRCSLGSGYVLGTPSYMPLEQLQGRPVQPASDLYALGGVAYGATHAVLARRFAAFEAGG